MQRGFLTNLAFVLVLNLLVKPAYVFGVEVAVQNRLGAAGYGIYFALLNTAFLLQIINDFGIQIFNNRRVSIDRKQASELFPGLVLLKVLFASFYLILTVLLGYFLGYAQLMPLLLLVGLNLVLTSFILFIRSGISGLGYYRIDSTLSVIDKVFMFLIIGGLLLFVKDGFSIYHFVLGQTVALFLTMLLGLLLLKRYSAIVLFWIPLDRLRGLARQALPYALVVFLMTLYTRLDGVMIENLLPDGRYEAGAYAAGYRILDAFNMVAYLFAALLLPMFSAASDSEPKLRKLIDEGFRYMWLLVVPLTTLCIVRNREIISFLYREGTDQWGTIFATLILGFVLMGMMYVFGTFLTAQGRVGAMNILFVVTVALNVVLNLVLIPQYKALGAAIATLITQFFAVLGILVMCSKILPLMLSWQSALRLLGFTLMAVGSCLVLARYSGLSVVALAPLYGLVALSMGVLFRMIRWKELRSMVRGQDQ